MEHQKIQQALFMILEAPNNRKGYTLLKKYYETIGMLDNANAIESLIEERFGSENHSTFNVGEK